MTTTQQLLALGAHDETVELAGGVKVRIRSTTLEERGRIIKAMEDGVTDVVAQLLSIAVLDPDSGEPLLTLEEANALQSSVAEELFEVASRLAGLGDEELAEEVDAAGKGSTETTSTG